MKQPFMIAQRPQWKGLPVPYVADWTGEQENIFRHDPRVGPKLLAWFSGGKPGDGQPIFGRQNPERQRECVIDMRCQVCHYQLSFPVHFIAGWIPRDGLPHGQDRPEEPVIEEPPLCIQCTVYALKMCPGLNNKHEGLPFSGNLVYRTYDYVCALQVVTPPEMPDTPVVHLVLAQLTKFETYTAKEFLEEHDHA